MQYSRDAIDSFQSPKPSSTYSIPFPLFMDLFSEESDSSESQWMVPQSDSDESQWIVPYDTPPRPTSSHSRIDDEKAPQKVSTDLHTNDCPFCSCLINAKHKFLLSMTEVQGLMFHEECQSCSSPDGAQTPLCDFCKHLRLAHLVKCIWKDSGLLSLLIDLNPISRALTRTECDLCDFLTNGTSLPQTGPSEAEIIPATSATMIIDGLAQTRIKGRRGNPPRIFSVNLCIEDHPDPTDNFIHFNDFVRWELIHHWLSKCKLSHKRFCAVRPRPTLPPGFQVIDVNKRCIVEREGSCEYIALSYVWGTRSESACYVEQATRDNIKSLKLPGGLTQLPETVEDAIAVCQKLGINYLWVDRYCIVQDHAIHKHIQVGAMADIYSSSAITIIACSGTDGVESGLPGVRRKRHWKRYDINIRGLAFGILSPHLDQIVPGSIWNTRGWTYQEAILSERKLLMTPTEVWFQCREEHAFREYFPGPESTKWKTSLRRTPGNVYMIYSVFEDYALNVARYTRRKLGYASDIYNAFDGIAQALYARDGSVHFGLPEPHFDAALLWYCGCRWNDSCSRCLRICAETTPSWSWGSVTCPIMYDDYQPFCMSLVKWVLYKVQVANMSSGKANPETYEAQSIELEAKDEPEAWERGRLSNQEMSCPQLFLALAINEGCIQAGKAFTSEQESLSSLKNHFADRWLTYTDAYNEVRQIDTCQSSRPNGVLFTHAQSAIFNIRSDFIQNANGLVIGRVYRAKLPEIIDVDGQRMYKESIDSRKDIEYYEECSNYEESCDDEDCCVEGIALSISEVNVPVVGNLINPDISLAGWWVWEKDEWKELLRDLTYFDCNDMPLTPVPRVNVMFIRWKDGYARRIGLGWIALKQWSSLDWTLKDIWLK